MEREEVKSDVESLLFVADGPQTLQRFAEVVEWRRPADDANILLGTAKRIEGQSRGLQLVEVAGGYQLRTAKLNADWVKKFLGGRPARMGKATLETLAIIAYRQPITKAEIEAIRGVDVDGVITTLLGAQFDSRGGAQGRAGPAVSLRHDGGVSHSFSISRILSICRPSRKWKRSRCRRFPGEIIPSNRPKKIKRRATWNGCKKLSPARDWLPAARRSAGSSKGGFRSMGRWSQARLPSRSRQRQHQDRWQAGEVRRGAALLRVAQAAWRIITTLNDPQQRPDIDALRRAPGRKGAAVSRWAAWTTTPPGCCCLTNDGELAHAHCPPAFGVQEALSASS